MQWGVDFLAGSISGFFGLSISYPLDIIKCRMQIEKSEYANISQSFTKILRDERIFGLYKGFTAPLINVIPINAFEYFRMFRILESHKRLGKMSRGVKQYFSGTYSGFIVVTIYTPLELLKLRIQSNKGKFTSMRELGGEILKKEGLKGFYRGYAVTLNRDVYSLGAYFYIYFGLKEYWERKNTSNSLKMFVAGGLAGVISWIICYPFDPMKTMIQTVTTRHIKQKEAFYIIKQNYGWKGFFCGMSPVLLKAFVQHGVVFKTSEYLRIKFNKMLN